MAINIFALKGELNGKNRSGVFLFLSGILKNFVYPYVKSVDLHQLALSEAD